MHFIVGILFGRFATKSLRYKTFRSTVFTHHFGKKDKILIFNFNVRFGALKRAAGFFNFFARPRTSQIRDYKEKKNVLQQIDFLMKRTDLSRNDFAAKRPHTVKTTCQNFLDWMSCGFEVVPAKSWSLPCQEETPKLRQSWGTANVNVLASNHNQIYFFRS